MGNEIPPSIVRWYGRQRIEGFIERLYRAAKSEHPEALVTYVNFPTTEYLELPFLDFMAFNVYLETPEKLEPYLARLQNLAGEKPLVLAEVGLDSMRNGEERQAEVLDWQIRSAAAAGCGGTFLFSWTDEWHRSGEEILDWKFGLTDRERKRKPALAAVAAAFDEVPLPREPRLPKISVVVCTYNGGGNIRETLVALLRLDYQDYEILVVNDGSTDATEKIVNELQVRLISTENRGLSHARNVGMREATGEIVAYIDDDAYPDPNWLSFLGYTFMTTDHVGVGGQNICPESDGEIARCVAHSPGGPNHVLLTDTVAEHIPGCNMAFRREALLAVGGFDEQFCIAGDDVDVCWKLQDQGGTLGFHAGAMVWHHCRATIRGYLKQQYNYGRAEAMLEHKWPSKYNSAGYPKWQGRVYGHGHREPSWRSWRVYHGVWGSNLFQHLYTQPTSVVASLPLIAEWYLLIAALALISLAGGVWPPLLWALPLLAAAAGVLLVQALRSSFRAPLGWSESRGWKGARRRFTIALLHLLQPIQRLRGRLRYGLNPLRRRAVSKRISMPRRRTSSVWSEEWRSPTERLEALELQLTSAGARVRRGGELDRFDLEIRGGLLGSVRLLIAIEEHGQGKQMVRVRSWPLVVRWALPLIGGLAALAAIAFAFEAKAAATVFAGITALLSTRSFFDCAAAGALLLEAFAEEERVVDVPLDTGGNALLTAAFDVRAPRAAQLSSTIRPSDMRTRRCACSATSVSWVTTTTVAPDADS